jgi:hypothetical protein
VLHTYTDDLAALVVALARRLLRRRRATAA